MGGMGEVYRARDTKLARDVAIKTLPVEFATDPNRLTRFHREARALATLNHPNIAAIYGLEESAGGSYLVLELVEGETLAERLSRTGPMGTGEVLRTASQIAEALEAAHAKRITHRDIKPANVKVTPKGRVKVLDFGLAKSYSGGAVHDKASILPTSMVLHTGDVQSEASTVSKPTAFHTERGAVVGTPPYMSPEQVRGQIADQRTDVWAFGCVVYELLTGRRAFLGSTISEIFAEILRGEPDWRALPADVPGSVRALLRRCLEKDASRRWQGFDSVRRELARTISATAGREHMRPQITLLFGAVPVALAALLAIGRPSLLRSLEYSVYDTILRWSTTRPPNPRIVIVDIDERSLTTIGQWPWRRDVIGRMIARLREMGAATVALDMMFAEPDRAATEAAFADDIRHGRVVLGYALTFDAGGSRSNGCVLHPIGLAIAQRSDEHEAVPFFHASSAICSLPMLAQAAGASGFLNATPDADGILRRVPLLLEFDGRVYPGLGLASVINATGNAGIALRVANVNATTLSFGDRVPQLDGKSNLLIGYGGRRRKVQYVCAAERLGRRQL